MKCKYDVDFSHPSAVETNCRMIAHTLGRLLLLEALSMAVCCVVSLGYQENDCRAFGITLVLCAFASTALLVYGRTHEQGPNRRESYVVVAFSWLLFTVFGMFALALMLIGRLEIFGFLLAFYPPTRKGSWAS